jgi:hypothetical protein
MAPHPLPPAAAGPLDHLLNTLVTQTKPLRDLPQTASRKMHSADDRMVFCASQLNFALGVRKPGSGGSRIHQ